VAAVYIKKTSFLISQKVTYHNSTKELESFRWIRTRIDSPFLRWVWLFNKRTTFHS